MKKLTEADFSALRGPFESGRQSPSHLGSMLLLSVPLHILVFVLMYNTVGYDTVFPYKDVVYYVHLVVTVMIIILSMLYGFSFIYMRSQKTQYLITIVMSQLMFGIDFLLIALFAMGSANLFYVDESFMLRILGICILTGILVFIVTSIRFYHLLKNGAYRTGTGKDLLRRKFEKKQLLVPAIIVGTGFVLITQSVGRNIMFMDVNIMVLLTIGPILFFTMLFVLPEQLVLLYCKTRFKTFNFDLEGNLIFPSTEGDEEENGV